MSEMIQCSTCGKPHPRAEMELSFKRPDVIAALTEDERKTDATESDDLCALRKERFFVRATLPLRVDEWNEDYHIGIWVEVGRETFSRILDTWTDPDQEKEPPMPAMLANDIPSFEPTCGMAVTLQLTGPTTRPQVLVPESDHPLHREQCLGISAHRAIEYSSYI